MTVDLVDEDGTFLDQANAHSVHVVNVAPTIAISGDANVERGLGLHADPGRGHRSGHRHRHDYIVHWGDGNSDTYTTAGAKTHTYADGDEQPRRSRSI